MVVICLKCRKVWGCINDEEQVIYLCKGCPNKEDCQKDREEFAKSIVCPDCSRDKNQLEFDFPN
jgi:hypothetical protein